MGRARKLRLNYRTTDEIRQWATRILEGMQEGGTDSLQDYRSLMHGEAPMIQSFQKREDELKHLRLLLEDIQANEHQLSTVCLAVRTHSLLDQYESALKSMNIAVRRIRRNQPDNLLEEGVRIGTMHRVKGLQFDYMVLPGLNADSLPLKEGLNHCADEVSRTRFVEGERSLLHVAATRAKKQVIVSYYGKPSPLLFVE
jgi:superfamily I DNA/RNA helicase